MRASLFVTCLGDHFYADAAVSAVKLLRSLGVDVDFPRSQACCGQPAFNAGRWVEARRMAEQTIDALAGTDYVVVPSGSCATMLRSFYGHLLEHDESASTRVQELAARTFELAEFIVGVLGVRELGRGLEGRSVAYHHGCHALRELGIRDQPLSLLEGAGATILPWEAEEECCGFGGLFSVKFPHVSVAMADRKLDTLPPPTEIDYLTSADGGCLLHLAGRIQNRGTGPSVRHLAEVLWEAANGHP